MAVVDYCAGIMRDSYFHSIGANSRKPFNPCCQSPLEMSDYLLMRIIIEDNLNAYMLDLESYAFLANKFIWFMFFRYY